ncbi:MAG TPA: hypothetical protein VF001_08445 [Candidatus Limnocylindria bacterium]
MKRILATVFASVLALAALAGSANAGDGKDKHDSHFGPYAGASPDSGTCGNDWANDTFKRFFTVSQDGGVWSVREDFKDGTFVTLGGASPGACQTGEHGTTVAAGVNGNFKGWLAGDVTGGTFDPDGTCADPCSGDQFIAAHFGATATWNVTSFTFEYHGEQSHLAFRHWQNASADQGGNEGDIATQ